MRIALVQCPVWGTREPPLALVQLSASLKSKGHEVRSFDLNNHLYKKRAESFQNLWAWEQSQFWYNKTEVCGFFESIGKEIDAYVESILEFRPSIAGFSIAASSYHASNEIARRLKKKNPEITIVYGGQLFLDERSTTAVFSDSPAAYAITDEADESFPELATLLEKREDVSKCRGIYMRTGTGMVFTGTREALQTLDAIPYMDFTDLRVKDYDDCVHISLMSSRGCIWNCAFCSSRTFWKGYRFMSGERIHQEVTYHRMMLGNDMCHVDFMDLVFNGNVQRVRDFCELMVRYPPHPASCKILWTANAVISPQLTPELLRLMAQAGCEKLIFGIESGSQNVLGLMHKRYRIDDAKKVIRDAAEAGIGVTANFMFGFPGETEEDFEQTLAFIRDTGRYLERAYPSRTYCALEEFSYLHKHPEEFSIKTPCSHHLYWETKDGKNTYPVRLKRCQRFEALCAELGVRVDCGVRTSVEMDEWFNLAHYYEFIGDKENAVKYFKKYSDVDHANEIVKEKLKTLAENHG